jgi:hypothetical protein
LTWQSERHEQRLSGGWLIELFKSSEDVFFFDVLFIKVNGDDLYGLFHGVLQLEGLDSTLGIG